jgi:hypothetical protein
LLFLSAALEIRLRALGDGHARAGEWFDAESFSIRDFINLRPSVSESCGRVY